MHDQNWYCITTAGGLENAANDRLQSRNIRTFYPRHVKTVNYFGSYPKPVISPFFPRYLFAQCTLEQYQHAAIGQRKEVLRMLDFGSGPAIVAQSVIDFLCERFDSSGMIKPACSPFILSPLKPGSRIVCNQYPFTGYEGTIQRAEKERVWALLRVIDDSTLHERVAERIVELPRSAVVASVV